MVHITRRIILPPADFFEVNSFEKAVQVKHQCQTVWDPDQARHFGPDLGPNCLSMLSTNDTDKELDSKAP